MVKRGQFTARNGFLKVSEKVLEKRSVSAFWSSNIVLKTVKNAPFVRVFEIENGPQKGS